jgi:hypothetical protein
MDGFKPPRKNRLDPFPDGFFQFLDGSKPSRKCVFLVVGIPFTEKIYIFICNGLIKIYILFMKPNQPYDEMYVLR